MVWARRLGLNLVLAVGVALVLLVPAAVRLVFRVEPELALFADAELSARLRQLVPYLTLCLAHGFAAGCLCGLLFRIPLFAGFVAFLASLLLVKLWAPSLVVGGLHWWQICGAPLLLLLTVLLLLGPWARDQLRSWRRGAPAGTGPVHGVSVAGRCPCLPCGRGPAGAGRRGRGGVSS